MIKKICTEYSVFKKIWIQIFFNGSKNPRLATLQTSRGLFVIHTQKFSFCLNPDICASELTHSEIKTIVQFSYDVLRLKIMELRISPNLVWPKIVTIKYLTVISEALSFTKTKLQLFLARMSCKPILNTKFAVWQDFQPILLMHITWSVCTTEESTQLLKCNHINNIVKQLF